MLRSCRADTFPGHRKREKAESNPGGVEGNDELKRKKNREVLQKEKEDEKKVEKGKILVNLDRKREGNWWISQH